MKEYGGRYRDFGKWTPFFKISAIGIQRTARSDRKRAHANLKLGGELWFDVEPSTETIIELITLDHEVGCLKAKTYPDPMLDACLK